MQIEGGSIIPVWSGRGYIKDVPDQCELKWRAPDGTEGSDIKALEGEAFTFPPGSDVRWRFLWAGRPGAWSEGLESSAFPPGS